MTVDMLWETIDVFLGNYPWFARRFPSVISYFIVSLPSRFDGAIDFETARDLGSSSVPTSMRRGFDQVCI